MLLWVLHLSTHLCVLISVFALLTTNPLIAWPLSEKSFLGTRHFPYCNYLCHTPDLAAVENVFNIFSHDMMLSWDLNLSASRWWVDALCVEHKSRVTIKYNSYDVSFPCPLKQLSADNLMYNYKIRTSFLAPRSV